MELGQTPVNQSNEVAAPPLTLRYFSYLRTVRLKLVPMG